MSKENVVRQAVETLDAIYRDPKEVGGPGAAILATIMVAQAVDRLTALLTPLVAEAMRAIEEGKASGQEK